MYFNFIFEFKAVLALSKMAGSAQTQKYRFHLNCFEHSICISLCINPSLEQYGGRNGPYTFKCYTVGKMYGRQRGIVNMKFINTV